MVPVVIMPKTTFSYLHNRWVKLPENSQACFIARIDQNSQKKWFKIAPVVIMQPKFKPSFYISTTARPNFPKICRRSAQLEQIRFQKKNERKRLKIVPVVVIMQPKSKPPLHISTTAGPNSLKLCRHSAQLEQIRFQKNGSKLHLQGSCHQNPNHLFISPQPLNQIL